MRFQIRPNTLLSALVFFLQGCASLSSSPPAPPENSLELSGRFSVRYEEGGEEHGTHGRFRYQQYPHEQVLSLSSPLEQTLARLTQYEQSAKLEIPGQPPHFADNLDSLVRQALPLPSDQPMPFFYYLNILSNRKTGYHFQLDQLFQNPPWQMKITSCYDESPRCIPKRIDIQKNSTALPAAILILDNPQ